MSAALTLTDCLTCGGEGFLFIHEGQANESPLHCSTCEGISTLEVCAHCGEVPTVEAGRELCPCVKVQVAA